MEIWDIYNINGTKTGRTIERGKTLSQGDYHLVVHIWLKDENDRYLIQKRASHLSLLPGVWAATGGSAVSGEESLPAAARETEEELGIALPPDQLALVGRMARKDSLADIWMAEVPSSTLDNVSLASEVAEVAWVTESQILKDRQSGGFHDYGDEYFDLLFGSDGKAPI